MATKRTKKTLGRAAVGITIVALAAVGLLGYKAAAGTSSSTSRYRTVTAAAGTVTQLLAVSGTVHHVTQASVSFPTSGIVTAVNVKAGDTVAAGQALASINATPLQNAVLAADAAYKSAVSQYQTDQQTYASSSSSSTTKAATTSTSRATTGTSPSQPSSGAPSSTGTPSGGGPGGGGGITDPAAAVKAATDAITALQAGVTIVETQLPIFVSDCIPLMSPTATVTETVTEKPTATVTVTVTETPTSSASVTGVAVTAASAAKAASSAASSATTSAKPKTSTTSTPNVSANAVISTTCQDAIAALTATNKTLPDQMTAANVLLTEAQMALAAEALSLTKQAAALSAQQAALAAQLAKQAAAAQQQSSSLGSTNSALQAAAAAGLSRSGGGSTVTAATLITDQATIQSSAILLATAQDQLSQATITSPIAGKVASMPFVVGQQASATATAVIIGTGAIEITVPVPLAKRAQVSTGQAATITSTIGGTTLTGTISRIGLLPTTTTSAFGAAAAATGTSANNNNSSSTSSTTYATVITIASGGDGLPESSRVGVTITTKTVDAAVVLPASAVTPIGTGSGTVQVITNGILSTKRVVTGAVGDSVIQIVSGVTAGEDVVIADVNKAIPGASLAASRGSQTAQAFPNGGGGNFTAGGPAGGNGGGEVPVAPPT